MYKFNHVKYSQDYSNPSAIWCKLLKVAHWKEKDRPSRWPKLLAALSYAEKLIEVSAFLFVRLALAGALCSISTAVGKPRFT